MPSPTDIGLEQITLTLRPLSPVRISAGDMRLGTGLIERKRKKQYYEVDEVKLAEKLRETGLLEDYLHLVEYWTHANIKSFAKDNTLQAFLTGRAWEKSRGFQPGRRLIEAYLNKEIALDDWAEAIIDQNRPWPKRGQGSVICDGHSKAYIPGTSIKGAIRTALLWKICNDNRTQFNRDVADILKKESGIDKLDQKLVEAISAYDLVDKAVYIDGYPRAYDAHGAHTSFMKLLAVSDSTPLQRVEQGTIQILSVRGGKAQFKAKRDKKGNSVLVSIPRKIYPPQDEFSIDITLSVDSQALKHFVKTANGKHVPFKRLPDVLRWVSAFYNQVWVEEQAFFCGRRKKGNWQGPRCKDPNNKVKQVADFYKGYQRGDKQLLRIGYGSGLLGTTLFSLLDAPLRKEIRNRIVEQTQGRDKKNKMPFLAPKSRRLVRWDNQLWPFGWMEMTGDDTDAAQSH